MKQDIRNGSIDLITPGELSAALHEHVGSKWSKFWRERYSGVKLMKLPIIRQVATGASVLLASNAPSAGQVGQGSACGPESGYVWMIPRLLVSSSSLTDAATYGLYSGSDFSLQQQSAMELGGPGGMKVNQGYTPGSRALWVFPEEELYANVAAATIGNTYMLSGIAIEAPFEMLAKLIT